MKESERLNDLVPEEVKLRWWNHELLKNIKKKEEEIGKLNAYIDELKHEFSKKYSKELEKQQVSNKEKNETIKELRKDINYLRGQIKTCQKIIKQKDEIIKRYERKNSKSSSDCTE